MKKLILAALIALPMSVFAQKFAHVNSATIIQAMPEYTTAQTEMQTLTKTYEDELTRMQDELKTKAEDYQKNGATLPDAVKQRRETELQELNQRIQQYYQTSQEELQKAQQTKMQAIQKKVTDAIKEVGVSGGYVYIMDVTAGIPFINETISTDVTSQVMAKLGIK
ncbi:MAG: OmpH family outer membrane protein [Bacteroidaceae bacterium]|jgi:outer membrane protein|nr:OmpH family outer membrane protein [Bacteroidaceae bacterium]